MDKKKIIQIIFIVLTFGISAYVLYNGFFSRSKTIINSSKIPGITISPSAISLGAANPILPYGGKPFDFSILKSQGLVFDPVDYPVLNPSSEVGVTDINLLIK